MPVEIKICGIREESALEAVIAAQADFGGFIFHPSSPRHLSSKEASHLTALARGRIRRVGLMVNPDDRFLDDVLASADLDILQLQGSESPARVAEIAKRSGLQIWKAISVASEEDVQRADEYKSVADFILFDAKTPPGALPGGMGVSFDWSLLSDFVLELPWGLAGGLDADNVATAIATTGAPMVDVCSGTESAPGFKDAGKVAAFCSAARGASQ